MKIDLSAVESVATHSDDLPLGEYHVKAIKAEARKSQKGTQGVNIEFVVQAGDHANRHVWDTWWLTPNTLGVIRARAEAFGVTNLSAFDPERDLIGLEAIGVVREDAYDGKVRNKLKAYLPLPAGARDPLAATAPRGGSSPVDGDDSIPFAASII